MNALSRQRLVEIVAQYGRTLGDDPRHCESLLRDLCGEHKRELQALIAAAKDRVPVDLRSSQTSKSPQTQLARLTQRLQDNMALSEDAARWAVETWALALGVVTAAQLPPERQASVDRSARQDATTVAEGPLPIATTDPAVAKFVADATMVAKGPLPIATTDPAVAKPVADATTVGKTSLSVATAHAAVAKPVAAAVGNLRLPGFCKVMFSVDLLLSLLHVLFVYLWVDELSHEMSYPRFLPVGALLLQLLADSGIVWFGVRANISLLCKTKRSLTRGWRNTVAKIVSIGATIVMMVAKYHSPERFFVALGVVLVGRLALMVSYVEALRTFRNWRNRQGASDERLPIAAASATVAKPASRAAIVGKVRLPGFCKVMFSVDLLLSLLHALIVCICVAGLSDLASQMSKQTSSSAPPLMVYRAGALLLQLLAASRVVWFGVLADISLLCKTKRGLTRGWRNTVAKIISIGATILMMVAEYHAHVPERELDVLRVFALVCFMFLVLYIPALMVFQSWHNRQGGSIAHAAAS
jgi:hypothetical protein